MRYVVLLQKCIAEDTTVELHIHCASQLGISSCVRANAQDDSNYLGVLCVCARMKTRLRAGDDMSSPHRLMRWLTDEATACTTHVAVAGSRSMHM